MTTERSYYRKAIAVAAICPAIMIGMLIYGLLFVPSEPVSIESFSRLLSDHFLYLLGWVLISAATTMSLMWGCNKLKADEIGLILQFGRPLIQVSSGFVFVPFFGPFQIWELQRETRLVIEEQFPEDDAVKAGTASTISITHGTLPSMLSQRILEICYQCVLLQTW